jgi:uncharacterized SAM-dependent methyltransferase
MFLIACFGEICKFRYQLIQNLLAEQAVYVIRVWNSSQQTVSACLSRCSNTNLK